MIDVLEESAIRRIPVVVQLRDGRVFEDRVAAALDLELPAREAAGLHRRRQAVARRH